MLEFDERQHVYRLQGREIPGVTQVLAPLVDFSQVPPAILEAKRDLGSRVHLATHLDDEQDLDETSVEDDVRPYLEAWRHFLRVSGAKVMLTEKRVLHESMEYAGTLDNVLVIEGQRWLIDKKTSISLPHAVGPQTAAYKAALGPAYADVRRAALRLGADGKFKFNALSDPFDWAVFVACLTLHNFRKRHPT